MTVTVIILVGVTVGLLSGLIGIGGGVLMVPFLYFFYERPEIFGVVVAPEARVVVSNATSLFVIVPTSWRAIAAFRKSELIEWRAVWPIGLVSLFSAYGGSAVAEVLAPELIKTGFGVLLIASGTRLMIARRSSGAATQVPVVPRLTPGRTTLTGLLVGFFSALLGVGGGIVGIPLMIYMIKMDVKKVAATSITIVGLTATAATLGYIVNGWGEPGLPPTSLGYVDLVTALIMFAGSVVAVGVGAKLNQRLKARTLEILFGVLFIVLGLRLAALNLLRLAGSALGV